LDWNWAESAGQSKANGPVGPTVAEHIQQELDSDPAFRKEWERLRANEEVAWSVIRLRMKLGISQEELAGRIGVSSSTISRLGSGRHSPNFATLRKIADAVGHKVVVSFAEPEPVTKRKSISSSSSLADASGQRRGAAILGFGLAPSGQLATTVATSSLHPCVERFRDSRVT